VDKKSVMTYVMCMYQVLPHEDDVSDQLVIEETTAADIQAANSSHTGKKSSPSKTASSAASSPLKVPPKVVTKGRTIILSIFT